MIPEKISILRHIANADGECKNYSILEYPFYKTDGREKYDPSRTAKNLKELQEEGYIIFPGKYDKGEDVAVLASSSAREALYQHDLLEAAEARARSADTRARNADIRGYIAILISFLALLVAIFSAFQSAL